MASSRCSDGPGRQDLQPLPAAGRGDVGRAKAKLRDLSLPTVEQVQKERAGGREKAKGPRLREAAGKAFDRDRQDKDWQERVIDAGIADALKKAKNARRNSRPAGAEGIAAALAGKLVNELRARHEQEEERFRYDRQKRRDAGREAGTAMQTATPARSRNRRTGKAREGQKAPSSWSARSPTASSGMRTAWPANARRSTT